MKTNQKRNTAQKNLYNGSVTKQNKRLKKPSINQNERKEHKKERK